MAIIALNPAQVVTDAGMTPAYQAGILATDTFTFPTSGREMLHLKHGAGASILTVTTRGLFRGKAVVNTTVNLVPAGDIMVGPFPTDLYADSGGLVTCAVSEATGFTVAVVRLPNLS
jgi:hypothetical protein